MLPLQRGFRPCPRAFGGTPQRRVDRPAAAAHQAEDCRDAVAGRMFMAKVAFLGLGVMGYPMAGHLKVKGGHEVTVYNRTAAKAAKWVEQFGGKAAPTPKAA